MSSFKTIQCYAQYSDELENFDILNAHSRFSIDALSDDYIETSYTKRIARALGNPKNVNLNALGEINARKNLIFNHYKKAFSRKDISISLSTRDFLNDIDPASYKKVSVSENNSLIAPITTLELNNLALELKPNKSVGLDNLSNEMVKTLILNTPEPFINAFNECLSKKVCFNNYFRKSYIKLIPKKDNFDTMAGWRPITIASVVFKLFSKMLYNRMVKITDRILGSSQKGFRPSKNINDVPLNIKAKLDSLLTNNKEALLLNLDFSRAFDTVNFTHITETLEFFGFNRNFIEIIEKYLEGGKSCVDIDDGSYTNFFDIEIGVGQGMPLSVLLFIIAIEPLFLKLTNSDSLGRFHLDHWTKDDRIEGFTDDATIFLRPKISELNF